MNGKLFTKNRGKKMKQIKLFFAVLVVLSLITACSEESMSPSGSDNTVPGQVSNVSVQNLPGGARITYKVPDDRNLLYVKAVCEISGRIREVKSSYYQNYLKMEGFGEAKEYVVKLYSVSRSEIASEPVEIMVCPTTPPFQNVFSTLDLYEDFGGATVRFKNPDEADLAISFLVVDSLGEWITAETQYTKRLNGQISLRGYDPEKRAFGVCIRDRWENRSDTLKKDLIPIFEEKLDIKKFKEVSLPGDEKAAWGWTMPHIWDGDIQNNTNLDKPGFHTDVNGVWPQSFTFSLGQRAKLSRFRYWQRGQYISFADRNVSKFEIWGSNDPARDGSWDSWTRLAVCESQKPSGLPLGQTSQEDMALIVAGEEFPISIEMPSVQYIRIRVTETFSGAPCFYIMQVAFWGSVEEESVE